MQAREIIACLHPLSFRGKASHPTMRLSKFGESFEISRIVQAECTSTDVWIGTGVHTGASLRGCMVDVTIALSGAVASPLKANVQWEVSAGLRSHSAGVEYAREHIKQGLGGRA